MTRLVAALLCCGLVFGALPARADFQYSDTAQITGGSLKGMMKAAGIFSKQASQAMKPINTTRYVKGDKLRTDHTDGKIEIIDLESRVIIEIDPVGKTYSQITFDEMKAAIQKAQDQAQTQHKTNQKDVNAKLDAKISVTPGTSGPRQILGQTTNELKVQIDMNVQAQQQPDAQSTSQQNGTVNATMSTSVDSWIAPSIAGYKEFGDFYRRMAKEINWARPANIQVDARVSQGLEELQKNQDAFKGLPLVQYMSMAMVMPPGSDASVQQTPAPSSSSSNDTAYPLALPAQS